MKKPEVKVPSFTEFMMNICENKHYAVLIGKFEFHILPKKQKEKNI